MSIASGFQKAIKTIAYAMLFAVVFGIVGAIGGFVIGLGISAFDEMVLNKGNPQGPLLFILTAPLGVVVGLAYGAMKGLRKGDPNSQLNRTRADSARAG